MLSWSQVVQLIAFLGIRQAFAGRNPCHPASHKVTPAYGCTKIEIPKGLCPACNIGNYNSRGAYDDCTKTTTTETPMCREKFMQYLTRNPCDTARLSAYKQYNSSNPVDREVGRSKIDYFLYSLCEQSKYLYPPVSVLDLTKLLPSFSTGCDCLPLESSIDRREVKLTRGNCQAHARYDTCKVLPNIKLIRGEGTADRDVSEEPRVCEAIATWWNSPDRDNWQNREDHTVAPNVASFLERSIEASELFNSTSVWNACFNLETSQDRIEPEEGYPSLLKAEEAPKSVLFKKYISCGGVDTVVDGIGRHWEPDTGLFRQGMTYRPPIKQKVENPDAAGMDAVYKSQRYHDMVVNYRIPKLEAGVYKVTFHFMEQFPSATVGMRRFHVLIQQKRVLRNYDPFAAAGGKKLKASSQTFYVNVTEGSLPLAIRRGSAGLPMLSAFSVEQMPPDFALPTDEETKTKTPTSSEDSSPKLPVRISMGSRAEVTVGNAQWLPDAKFISEGTGSTRNVSTRKILNLRPGINKEVMRTIRFGPETWTISIPNLPPSAKVWVRLHFNELNLGAARVGARIFHVQIQQKPVLRDFDIFEAAGAPFKAIRRNFRSTVATDGTLTVTMEKGPEYFPAISAVEVLPRLLRRKLLVNETIPIL